MTNNNSMNKQDTIRVLYTCLLIEADTKLLMLSGMSSLKELIAEIDSKYVPSTIFEMEMYSEAIINARMSLLN